MISPASIRSAQLAAKPRLLSSCSLNQAIRRLASLSNISNLNVNETVRRVSHAYRGNNRLILNNQISALASNTSILSNLNNCQHWPTKLCQRNNSTATKLKTEHFILPDIGEGINEVVIKEWLVKVGDQIKEFDPICEVESDKATATISSRYDGIITKIHYDVGVMAKVGKPLVDIEVVSTGEQPAESVITSKKDDGETRKDDNLKTQQVIGGGSSLGQQQAQVSMLPSVRRLAAEMNVDLGKVKPTGKKGRVTKEDIQAYIDGTSIGHIPEPVPTPPPAARLSIEETLIKPLTNIQRAMVKTMTESLKIPHFNYSDEINMSKLVEFNRILKEEAIEKRATIQVSNLAFIIKMVSLALLEYPQLNASLDERQENLIQKNYHNIGVAVDTKAGLIVPNIKNVESLSIRGVNSELIRLRQLGYESKLGLKDLSNSTITLSNIGAIGGIFGVPVLVSPEIVIGALGRTRRLPRFNCSGQLEERHIMQIVWSADHRVVDGATLSRFNNLLKSFLEEPSRALMEMS